MSWRQKNLLKISSAKRIKQKAITKNFKEFNQFIDKIFIKTEKIKLGFE
jgi:hypothetical protein